MRVLTIRATDVVGDDAVKSAAELTTMLMKYAASRWPEAELDILELPRRPSDPRPDLAAEVRVLEVLMYRTVVERVDNPWREIGRAEIPAGVTYSGKLGTKWYTELAHVIVDVHLGGRAERN